MEKPLSCDQCGIPLPGDGTGKRCPQCQETVNLTGIEGASELALPAQSLQGIFEELERRLARHSSRVSPENATPMPGQAFGKYSIIKLLGAGGMGTVFEAEDRESGRRLALKTVQHSLDSASARQRFLREGWLAASINHPNCVYVFGTEEIGGTPVITMELMDGGTLQERVQQDGAMAVGEAVEAALQVIAGLEAAAANGVLHRDVKPSNCFVDTNGTVKVGDFGLSVSRSARAETNLTQTEGFIGTPAYSSPEQLQGEEVDLRSDIYAVGVTLFYLLTGKTPFAAANVVQLLARVLESSAESPAKMRAEVPTALGNVVLRCLSKKPGHRFQNYEGLRQALWPFSRQSRVAAPLPLRFLAGCLDCVTLSMLVLFVQGALMQYFIRSGYDSNPAELIWYLSPVAVVLLYFSLAEGFLGASLGKVSCGLRVMAATGEPVGFSRALLRAFLFPTSVFITAAILWNPLVGANIMNLQMLPYSLLPWGICLAIAFSTARCRTGFAGLQDLGTRTRVILRRRPHTRAFLPPAAEPQTASTSAIRIGPYEVVESLTRTATREFLLGYDPLLRRNVWLVRSGPAETEIFEAGRQRDVPGQLRWLTGKRTPAGRWDAFETVVGEPLLQVMREAQSWAVVRVWLHDLSGVFHASNRVQPPSLGLDRVWIGADGHARLLPFAAPWVKALPPADPTGPSHGLQSTPAQSPTAFLKQVAVSALHGCAVDSETVANAKFKLPLPLAARSFLSRLSEFADFDSLCAELQALLKQPATVTTARRGLSLWLGFWPLFVAAVVSGLHVAPALMNVVQSEPDLDLLRHSLGRIVELQNSPAAEEKGRAQELNALRIYVAARFPKALATYWVFESRGGLLPSEWRPIAWNIREVHEKLTQFEVQQATNQIGPFLARYQSTHRVGVFGEVVRGFEFMMSSSWLQFLILPALVAAMVLRGGLLLRATGIALVTRQGAPASRARALARSVVTWSPVLTMPLGLAVFGEGFELVILAVVVAGFVAALWTPERALQDRFVGTWLVPS